MTANDWYESSVAVSDDVLAPLLDTHPALIDSAVRWRGVGGWGATATILRSIDSGAVAVGVANGSITLRLVPGVATPRRARSTGPYVERSHIEGLCHLDRRLLVILFDEMAHASVTDIAQLARYRNARPMEFWRHLKSWRTEVDTEASRLATAGRLPVSRTALFSVRGDLVDRLSDTETSASAWASYAGVAAVAGLDDIVAKTAHERFTTPDASSSTGAGGVALVCRLRSGRRTGLETLRRFFSPLQPSGYPPAQYTKIVLPSWYARPRIVDDGSQRIGG